MLNEFNARFLEHLASQTLDNTLPLEAITGTGKTVVAALDYARLRKEQGELSLLFVAHRQEILKQGESRCDQMATRASDAA